MAYAIIEAGKPNIWWCGRPGKSQYFSSKAIMQDEAMLQIKFNVSIQRLENSFLLKEELAFLLYSGL